MTIVVGSSSLMDGFMIADCQLTYPGPRGTFRYRDVCQKLFVTEYGVVVGIAGNVCLAKYIAAGLINYLDVHSGDRQQWLNENSGDTVYRFITAAIMQHFREFPDHQACRKDTTSLMIMSQDFTRRRPDGTWVDPIPLPVMFQMALHYVRGHLFYKQQRRGTLVIGRSHRFAEVLHTDEYEEVVTHFSKSTGVDRQVSDAHRGLAATEFIRKRLTETRRGHGVGGLYQVVTFGPYGVQTVPYFYLDHVAPGLATYVAMRIDNGEWVQEHRPTNTKMRLKTPWDLDPLTPPRFDMRFDSSVRLNRQSPGVIPRQNPEVLFSLYNPPDVPPAVQASWGDAPLVPLTYGAKFREFDGVPRWPGY